MAQQSRFALVADGQPLSRTGMAALLGDKLGVHQVVEASNAQDLLAACGQNPAIDLTIITIDLPGLDGTAGIRDFRIHHPSVRVIVIGTSIEREAILKALASGAHGYIPSRLPIAEMIEAIEEVRNGHIYVPNCISVLEDERRQLNALPASEGDTGAADWQPITERQKQVLDLLARGKSNKEIARILSIAEGTVKVHVSAVFRMLNVHNRVSVIAALHEHDRRSDHSAVQARSSVNGAGWGLKIGAAFTAFVASSSEYLEAAVMFAATA